MEKIVKVLLVLLIIPFSFIMLYSCAFELPKEPVDDPVEEEPLISYKEIADIKYHEKYDDIYYTLPQKALGNYSFSIFFDNKIPNMKRSIRYNKDWGLTDGEKDKFEMETIFTRDTIYPLDGSTDICNESLLIEYSSLDFPHNIFAIRFKNHLLNSVVKDNYYNDIYNQIDRGIDYNNTSNDMYIEIIETVDDEYYSYRLFRLAVLPGVRENSQETLLNYSGKYFVYCKLCESIIFEEREKITYNNFDLLAKYLLQKNIARRNDLGTVNIFFDDDSPASFVPIECFDDYFYADIYSGSWLSICYNSLSAIEFFQERVADVDKTCITTMRFDSPIYYISAKSKVFNKNLLISQDTSHFFIDAYSGVRMFIDNEVISYQKQIKIYDAIYRYFKQDVIKDETKIEMMDLTLGPDKDFYFPCLLSDDDKYTVLLSPLWYYLDENFDTIYINEMDYDSFAEVYDILINGKLYRGKDFYLNEIFIYDKEEEKVYNISEAYKREIINSEYMVMLLEIIDSTYLIKRSYGEVLD